MTETIAVTVYAHPLAEPVQTMQNVSDLLHANRAGLAAHVARVVGLDVDLIISTGISAIALADKSVQDKLLSCTGKSVLKSVADACRYGMVIGGVMGQAYLVPFKNQCQLMVGYRGYEALAYRSGQVKAIQSGIVYKGDEYTVNIGSQPPIVHKPVVGGRHDDEDIVAAYAIAWISDNLALAEHMNRQDLNHIRSKSRMANFGAYITDLAEMFRKAPIRRLCKHVNLSPYDRAILEEIAVEEDRRAGAVVNADESLAESKKRTKAVLDAADVIEPEAKGETPPTEELPFEDTKIPF